MARPSRKRGFETHCRLSWNSACMMPMRAGPPKPVAPNFQNPAAISFQAPTAGSVIELHLCAAAAGQRSLVDHDGGGDVLQGGSRAVEDNDLVAAGPPGATAGDDIGQLGVHALPGHQSGR